MISFYSCAIDASQSVAKAVFILSLMHLDEFEDDPYEADDVTISEEDGIRYLHFGTHWIQGAMRMSKPNDLVLSYTQQMMAWMLFHEASVAERIAFLGLGAGSLLRFCMRYTPSQLTTVEINPQVTAMCRAFFRLPENERSIIEHDDALEWVLDPVNKDQFQVLMVDLYDANAQGPVCSTVEFYQGCYQALTENGIASINLFGSHPSFQRNLDNIRTAFKAQLLVLPEIEEGNTIVLAFKGLGLEMTTQELLDRADIVQQETKLPARRWAKALLSMRSSASTFTIAES